MGGDVRDEADQRTEAIGFEAALREAVEEMFDCDVAVTVFENRGKYDVRVEAQGMRRSLEASLDEATVVPYSDLKFTVSRS